MKVASYVGTRNVYDQIIPSLKSLIFNSDVERVYLLIEDDEFPIPVPEIVRTVNVSRQQFFYPSGPNYSTIKWTWMTMMRAALPLIFPQHDLILSLDNDTIIVDDISNLWDLPIGKNYFSAAREPKKSKGGSTYICDIFTQMGVVLYNLKALRDSGAVFDVLKALNTRRFIFAEQDAFNVLCQGRIHVMPSQYNVNEFTEPFVGNPKIYHYAATNGRWLDYPIVKAYREARWMECH